MGHLLYHNKKNPLTLDLQIKCDMRKNNCDDQHK